MHFSQITGGYIAAHLTGDMPITEIQVFAHRIRYRQTSVSPMSHICMCVSIWLHGSTKSASTQT